MVSPKTQRLLRLLLFLATLFAIHLLHPGALTIILREPIEPASEIQQKLEYVEGLKSQGAPLPFSETTDSLMRTPEGTVILNAAKNRVLEIMRGGVVDDLSILRGAGKVEIHLKNRSITSSPDEILDVRRARSLLLQDTVLFVSPSSRVAYVEFTAYLLGANLKVAPQDKLPVEWIRFGLLLILMFLSALYLGIFTREKPPSWSDLLIISITGILAVLTSSLVIRSGLSPYLTILPFFGMVINVTMNLGAALFFTTLIAIVIGIYSGFELAPFVFNATLGWVAAFSTRNFKNRYQIYWVVALLIILGGVLTWILSPFAPIELWNPLGNVRDSTISALVSGFLVVSLLPLFEKMFKISTDFLLLELSNLNNPLLRRLSTKAAGTFTHSILIGNLCEAGARVIGANPLLARVAAYYHDIGKLSHPEFFIENQLGKKNPHDSLPPEESRRILLSHIEEGTVMGKKAGLPREVIGVIETHHGTTLMTPFFSKARAANPEEREENYRYPGPKPRTKVEALCMLADAVEAASRSLENPTSDELRDVIARVMEDRLKDGQLDNTDLTQRDLKAIEDAFYKVLTGVFHPRIKYPEEGR